MALDNYFQIWQAAHGRHEQATLANQLKDAIAVARNPAPQDLAWLLSGLLDNHKKFFVAYLLRQAEVFPQECFDPLLHAAVYELNPSMCRTFVEPCVRAFGQAPVIERLLRTLRLGTNFEKAGAINALHFTYQEKSQDELTAYRSSSDTNLNALVNQRRTIFLETFLENDDLEVQRSLIQQLELAPLLYPAEFKEKIEQAIAMARTHSDEYVRHRVEVQLGRARSIYPLPHRRPPADEAPLPEARRSWWQVWR